MKTTLLAMSLQKIQYKALITILVASTTLYSGLLSAQEAKEPVMPSAVASAEKSMSLTVEKATDLYVKTVEGEVKKLRPIVEKALSDATKAGNFELSVELKNKLDDLTVDNVLARTGASAAASRAMVGRWEKQSTDGPFFIEFKQNGTFVCNGSLREGTWAIKQNQIVATARDGRMQSFGIQGDKLFEGGAPWVRRR